MARFRKKHLFKLIATFLFCFSMVSACQSSPSGYDTKVVIHDLSVQPAPSLIAHPISLSHSSGQANRWVSYTNIDGVAQIAIDQSGNIWTVGRGGVVRWDPQTKAYQVFTTSDGLPENFITALAVSPDNKIWVGTYTGYIAEYDGSSWTTIKTKPGDIISCLAIATDGALWVGTNRGINKFDGEHWYTYTIQQGVLDNYIHSIAVTSTGTVWVGAIGGVSFFDGTIWHSRPLEKGEIISSIVEAPDKTVWFGSENALIHLDGSHQWEAYLTKDTLGSISAMAISPQGKIWLAVMGSGLASFDENDLRFVRYPVSDISSMTFSGDGNLWLGSYRSGIFRFDEKVLDSYKAVDEPIENFIISSAIAPDGSLWFGTDRGASRFDGEDWKNYTTADGLANNSVLSIAAAPDGSVWFGTENGVSVFNGNSWNNYGANNGLTDGRVNDVAVTLDGTVWAVSQTSLFRLNGDGWSTITSPMSNSFQTIAAGTDDSIWVAATNGVGRFDGQNWISVLLPIQAPIMRLVQSQNRDLWIETIGSGLFFISGQVWDQVSSGNIQSITLDSGGLVHATSASGNTLLNGTLWSAYTQGDGLPGNEIRAIAPKQDGSVWVVTDQGIFSPTGNTWTNYFGPLMLGTNKFSTIVVDQQGSIWIGMPLGGLAKFTP